MRSKRTGLRAVMVTQLVLLLPIMIAMLALVVDCANMSRCKALASSAASEGARYAAANPDLTDSEVETYVRGQSASTTAVRSRSCTIHSRQRT